MAQYDINVDVGLKDKNHYRCAINRYVMIDYPYHKKAKLNAAVLLTTGRGL